MLTNVQNLHIEKQKKSDNYSKLFITGGGFLWFEFLAFD